MLGLPDLFQPQMNFFKKLRGERLILTLSIKLRGKRREDREELLIRTDTEELTSNHQVKNSKKTN